MRPQADPFIQWLERGHNALRLLAGLWLGYAAIRLGSSADAIAHLSFRDPDDALRLVQVRDFIAGQNWFDVSQHRINPPVGGPMHWSRLVDLPLAAIILLLRPLLGQALAEGIACAVVPLLILGLIGFGLFAALHRLTGKPAALLAVLLLGTSIPILAQTTPLRIDHHGWQIAMAVGLLIGLLHPDPRKGGWIMGAAIAMWLHISSEGLPYAALAGGIAALRYGARASEWPRLIRYAGMMAGGSVLLLLATHGWRESLISHCDAMSPVYLGPILLLVPVLLTGRAIAGESTPLRRLLPVLAAGGCAAALFATSGGPCLAGPFSMLDPLTYRLWYLNIAEGRPIWEQTPQIRAIILLPALLGIAATVAALIREKDESRRLDWLSILGMTVGAFAISLTVFRAISVSHLFALTGNAWLIGLLWSRIAQLRLPILRLFLTIAILALTPIGLTMAATYIAEMFSPPLAQKDRQAANYKEEIGALDQLPKALIFSPLDVAAFVLVKTGHYVVATSHHRNAHGIGIVIRAFTSPPDKARTIIAGTHARYLLVSSEFNETDQYRKAAPQGLAARLVRGEVPAWLAPVPLPGLRSVKLYRIVQPSPGASLPR